MGLFCVFLLTSPALATFPDVDEYSGYMEAIEYVSELGIMVGDGEGNFNPNRTVTRAQMAVIICRLLEKTENLTASTQFSDVPTNFWANTYISKVAELGIVSGYSNGAFCPSNPVTYEQAIKMIVQAVGYGEDATQSGGYPEGFIKIATEAGLLENLTANRSEVLSRADIAIILYNYYVPPFMIG